MTAVSNEDIFQTMMNMIENNDFDEEGNYRYAIMSDNLKKEINNEIKRALREQKEFFEKEITKEKE